MGWLTPTGADGAMNGARRGSVVDVSQNDMITSNPLKAFDIAISYASEEAWLAKDLYDLLTPYGLSVYCFDRMPDESRGFLRERLSDIYTTSGLNILIWSESYSKAAQDSFPAMERRFIIYGHVHKGEAASLLPICVDSTVLGTDLDITLVHDLKKSGVVGLEQLVIERLRALGERSESARQARV